jgi:2-polyprenyl-6-methoxyphenol hydroxylase-like FAD-dependent oxidoreductase
MLLAGQGHRVLLMDRATMPSDTVSTHAITRSGVVQLSRWGLEGAVAEMTAPVREVVLGFDDERVRFDVRLEHGVDTFYAPRRHYLDGLLVDSAVEAGAEFVGGSRVTDLVWSGGEVCGVVAEGDRISARMVIGADGVWSKVASLVGASDLHRHEPMNAVSYAYYTGIDFPGFWFQFTSGVNAGLINTSDGEVCVFAGRPADEFERFRLDPEAEFDHLLARAGADLYEIVGAGTRVSSFRGTPGLPGFIRRAWGPGWALVGDAGYTKDPISAHGISDAFRDAELCARAVHRSLIDPSNASEAMRAFQRERDRLSWTVLRQSESLAAYGWGGSEASRRMRAISELVKQESTALCSLPEWPAAAYV